MNIPKPYHNGVHNAHVWLGWIFEGPRAVALVPHWRCSLGHFGAGSATCKPTRHKSNADPQSISINGKEVKCISRIRYIRLKSGKVSVIRLDASWYPRLCVQCHCFPDYSVYTHELYNSIR